MPSSEPSAQKAKPWAGSWGTCKSTSKVKTYSNFIRFIVESEGLIVGSLQMGKEEEEQKCGFSGKTFNKSRYIIQPQAEKQREPCAAPSAGRPDAEMEGKGPWKRKSNSWERGTGGLLWGEPAGLAWAAVKFHLKERRPVGHWNLREAKVSWWPSTGGMTQPFPEHTIRVGVWEALVRDWLKWDT